MFAPPMSVTERQLMRSSRDRLDPPEHDSSDPKDVLPMKEDSDQPPAEESLPDRPRDVDHLEPVTNQGLSHAFSSAAAVNDTHVWPPDSWRPRRDRSKA